MTFDKLIPVKHDAKTSVDFQCWWQNAAVESDLGCGCLLSSLDRF